MGDWKNHPQSPEESKDSPNGFTHTWWLWRNCCCRYGWYPLIVAPVVTVGCLSSLYASAGCDFVRVNVGFTPSNPAWNQSTAELGLFYYQSGDPETNVYREAFLDGCRSYTDDFTEDFVDDDRTWKVARIMAYISGISSIVATITAWLFVVSPLPAFFFWPGVLLPSIMAAFLAEGSKFLFFDTAICRNTVWFPSGADSLPHTAEECVLGSTGHFAIAAGCVFFLSLILVCLKAPDKRILDKDYGVDYGVDYDRNARDVDSVPVYGRSVVGSYAGGSSAEMYDANGSEDRSYGLPQSASRSLTTRDDMTEEMQDTLSRGSSRQVSRGDSDYQYGVDDHASHKSGDIKDNDDLISERLKNLDPEEDKYTAKPKDDLEDDETDDRYQPTKPAKVPSQTISESRLHTVERMKKKSAEESEDLIENFVNELNVSFQVDAEEEKTKKDHTQEEEKDKTELIVEAPGFCQTLCGPQSARSF